MKDSKSDTFIRDLQKTGLNYEESTIYFALLQKGAKGAFASELASILKTKRTSMLSKLTRLVQKGYVNLNKNSQAPRGIKHFIVLNPTELFRQKIDQTRQQLDQLARLGQTQGKRLEQLYQRGIDYGPEELDPFLKPYLAPLLESGWRLIEQDIEESRISHGFDVYDCTLIPPKAQFIKDCGLLAFSFHHIVEGDNTTIEFIVDLLLRRSANEIFQKDIGVKDIRVSKTTINLFNHDYPSLRMEFLFSPHRNFQELSKSVILPINDKIFFLWGEDLRIVSEMAGLILRVEEVG